VDQSGDDKLGDSTEWRDTTLRARLMTVVDPQGWYVWVESVMKDDVEVVRKWLVTGAC
jgi:hypothetical protein